jgi:hypothetical protein
MSIRSRLIFMLLSLAILVLVGRVVTGNFSFILSQFWFTAGFLLLILLSLIDQPHFSKDANVFVNAATAVVSLLLIDPKSRDGVWCVFLVYSGYLLVASYILMFLRQKPLATEPRFVQAVSRINRQIGRPESLFSAFFLWGCIRQFGAQSPKLTALLIYWAAFMLLNTPSLAGAIDSVFSIRKKEIPERAGVLVRIISPRIAEIELNSSLSTDVVGRLVEIKTHDDKLAATAVLIDDRIVTGKRIGKLAITSIAGAWSSISAESGRQATIEIGPALPNNGSYPIPISVVDVGSEIGKMVLHAHPNIILQAGEVLWVNLNEREKAFYQIVAGQISQAALEEGNYAQTVRVSAGQLGVWDQTRCRFEPVTWVAPAGALVYRATALSLPEQNIPVTQVVVGKVPNSDFQVHVGIEDTVTHNTAIIGVTGSGKSYLAFHLIEAMAASGIKVLILDLSRQHWIFLKHLSPKPLPQASDVAAWFKGSSPIGIYQFTSAPAGYPKATRDFVEAAFNELSKTQLKAGVNEPARLCIVFEEAHSLIPEWNQVAQPSDTQQVNGTARNLLQGRKFGMGCLVVTQRTANVTKTILNQCNTIFALQSFDQTGLDFLHNYMGEEYAHAISTLPTRHAILVGKASSSARPILFRVEDFAGRWSGQEASTETKTTESSPVATAEPMKVKN